MAVGFATSTLLCFIIVINLIFESSLWCINRVREPLCKPNFVFIFVLGITSGPRLKFVGGKNIFTIPPPPTPPVDYATDRSKAGFPLLFLFCVTL